jgi:hypothetical protein
LEARATVSGTSISKTLVAASIAFLAIGVAAMSGYVAKGLGAGAGSVSPAAQVQVHPAPGTVLRQDNPSAKSGDTSAVRPIRGGTRGDHGELP